MPRISALPPKTRAAGNDQIPINSADDITTKRIEVNSLSPTGSIVDFAGNNPPDGWLLCYGQSLNATSNPQYAALWAVLGTLYGGSGITDFKVPDLRGRVVAGQDDMGGTSANRLTGTSGSVDGDVLGGTGGAEQHTLTNPQMPTHSVTISHHGDESGSIVRQFSAGGGWNSQVSAPGQYKAPPGSTGGAGSLQSPTANWGENQPHNNVQPTIILNKIIKY